MANVKNVAPGIGLCAAIAIPCWFLGEALPVVGGPVFAILIGMVIALWWKQPARGTVQASPSRRRRCCSTRSSCWASG